MKEQPLTNLTAHKLEWSTFTLYIFSCEEGTVSLEIYPESPDKQIEVHALICNLWVKEQYRRQGVAKQLMEIAHQQVKVCGYEHVFLYWRKADSTYETFDWYERLGYDEASFGNGISLMKKCVL